jgi:hypothetical protein
MNVKWLTTLLIALVLSLAWSVAWSAQPPAHPANATDHLQFDVRLSVMHSK